MVIAGLDPAIHHVSQEGVLRRLMDARIKSGHDRENRGRRRMMASHPFNRTTVL